MSDKRQQALGGVDKPEENWIYHPSRCSIWGWSKRLFVSFWCCSFLLRIGYRARVSLSFTFFPLYYSTNTEAHLQPNTSSESKAKVTADVPITHPPPGHWITSQSMSSWTLQLILERKRHQDKKKRTKIRQCICVTIKLVNHGQREVWNFLLCPKETKQPYPGPLSASADWVRGSTVEHHLR